MDDLKKIVQHGYDTVSEVYREDDFIFYGTRYEKFFDILSPYIEEECRVLDLGCGCGIPVAQYFSLGYDVTGVDISEVQIERARKLVPDANFICTDMTQYNFKNESFDVILSFYTLFHIPLNEQLPFLRRITEWLSDEGLLVLTVGGSAWTGMKENWRGKEGVTMYWSQTDRDTYEQWLLDLGYEIIEDIFITHDTGGHNTFIARKL